MARTKFLARPFTHRPTPGNPPSGRETVNSARKRKLDESRLDCSDRIAITCVEEWMVINRGDVPSFDSLDSLASATIGQRANLALNVYKSLMHPWEADSLRSEIEDDQGWILDQLDKAVRVKLRELFLIKNKENTAALMPLCLQHPENPLKVINIQGMMGRLRKVQGIQDELDRLESGIPGGFFLSQ